MTRRRPGGGGRWVPVALVALLALRGKHKNKKHCSEQDISTDCGIKKEVAVLTAEERSSPPMASGGSGRHRHPLQESCSLPAHLPRPGCAWAALASAGVVVLLAWTQLAAGLVCPLEVSVSSGSIQVARGQTAVLPCTFTTNAALTNLNVIWMVIPLSNANQPQQVILYQGGQIFGGAPQFYGRVGFAVTMPTTSASIFINNTQLSDTGTYQCLVNNLPDRGVRNIGVIGLTVLVPPSAPLCRIQGSLDVGSDITLTCSSEEGIPRPTYLWEKLDNVPKLPPTATQDQVQGTVTLRNISTVSSGLYQCVASNAIGTSTCLLDLQVIAPHPRSIGLIAGAVATGAVVLVVCIVLVAVALFYWKNKHKEEEEEEIPNEIREDDLPPKCSSAAKTFHADASSSENDTLTSSNTYNSRYWNDPKANHATDSFTRFSNSNDAHQPPFSRSGSTSTRPVYANGGHPSPAPPKTLVVTASTAPSPQEVIRSNGSVSRKPRLPHTRSYAVSQATLERIGAVPVMVPAQSRAGSLV